MKYSKEGVESREAKNVSHTFRKLVAWTLNRD